ncbi:MAG: nucleotide exchange factor GrpE [Candidatus Omnitrophica bacterium]|nr:nucleotide exchange factor GrpE [Candidatus Omnitrophota bacterium]
MTKKKEAKHYMSKIAQQLEEDLKEVQRQRDDFSNKHLRICADFDNARKRWDREKTEVIKFANFTLLRELTSVLDDIDHALKAAREHAGSEEILKGLEMTHKNFLSILTKKGVEIIETDGKKFDPYVHEIITSAPAPQEQEHMILQEVQRGYLYEGKVLRTAKVIVGVLSETTDQGEETKD